MGTPFSSLSLYIYNYIYLVCLLASARTLALVDPCVECIHNMDGRIRSAASRLVNTRRSVFAYAGAKSFICTCGVAFVQYAVA